MAALDLPDVPGVRHHLVDVDDVCLHVAEAGCGPVLLCLHGWPQRWWTWWHLLTEPVPAGLSRSARFRVVVSPCGRLRQATDGRRPLRKARRARPGPGLPHRARLGGGRVGFLLRLRAPHRFERYLALNTGRPSFDRLRVGSPRSGGSTTSCPSWPGAIAVSGCACPRRSSTVRPACAFARHS